MTMRIRMSASLLFCALAYSLSPLQAARAAIVYTNSFPTAFWGSLISSEDIGGGEWNSTMFVIHFTGASFNNDYFTTNDANVFRTYATYLDPGAEPPAYFPVPANVNQYGADRHTITDLAFGSLVSSSLTWSTFGDPLTEGTGKYWGLESTEGTNVYYGWIRYDSTDGGKTLNFIEAAFNDVPGAPITVGAVPVPEPATFTIACAGLTCGAYTLFRRRKRA